ncbi:MAG: energy transducer TonB family protein [Bdellovibrionia bacterium]
MEVQWTEKAKPSVPKPKTHLRIVETEFEGRRENPRADAYLGQRTQTVAMPTRGRRSSGVLGHRLAEAPKNRVPLSQLGVNLLGRAQAPSFRSLTRGSMAGEAGEELDALPEGDRTVLNTREYRYYGYFQRIRERLDQSWSRSLKEKLSAYFQRGGSLKDHRNHVTRLLVVLDPTGTIIRVSITGESGTMALDWAAVSAFNQAGPFPHPPKGIIDQNREVQIFWDFVLKT